MKTRLLLVWATVWSLGAALVDRFRPLARTGLVTTDDVDAFVAELNNSAPADPDPAAVAEVVDEAHERLALTALSVLSATLDKRTPIFDALTEERPALYARRALEWPTSEFDVQWRGLTSVLAMDWLCTGCESGGHAECPGCSCACSMAVTA